MSLLLTCRDLVAGVCAASLASAPLLAHAGNLNAEIDQMFNDLGTIGNYTQPGAFQGQTYGTYVGGSIYYRAPNKTYQLLAIDWPTSRAGCGGIDLFGGSFSHISAAEFKNMLKNITAALPGVAFQLALGSVSPLLKSIASEFKAFETWINNARINSCETATSLVSSAAEAAGYDAQRACAKIAQLTGLEPDIDAAMRRCASNAGNVLANARASGDAEVANLAPFVGNLTWRALKSIPTLDDPARELVMSIAGTVIYAPESAGKAPEYVAPAITRVEDLLYGVADAPGQPGKIRVRLLKCNNYAACDVVSRIDNHVHEPLTTKVETMMNQLAKHIADRTPIPNNNVVVGFVNSTSLPLWRMLSVGSTLPGGGMVQTLIEMYKDIIAADYAVKFLTEFAGAALTGLQNQYSLTGDQRKEAADLRTGVHRFIDGIHAQRSEAYAKVRSVTAVVEDLERFERNLRAALPAHILDMLAYTRRPY